MRRLVGVLVPMAFLSVALPLAPQARATFPGGNGVIAYQYGGFGGPGTCPEIHTIDPTLGPASDQNLTNGCPQGVFDPSWDAGASTIAITSLDTNHNRHLATISPSGGGGITNLSVSGASGPRDASFDAAGTVIAFGAGDAGGGDSKDIYTVPAAGGPATKLTNAGAAEVNKEPDYSPVANRIAWVGKTGPNYDVFTMDVDANGQNPTNVTNLTPPNDGDSQWPSWSPDGSYVAFASDRFGIYEIFVLDVSGGPNNGQLYQITDETTVNDIQPTWSPDQQYIAYTRGCSDDQCNGYSDNGDIWVVGVADLANPSAAGTVIATSKPESDPDWGTTCSSNCPVSVSRSVSLALKGHLTASGTLTDLSGQHPECAHGRKVNVQRNNGTSWKTAKTLTTDSSGHYVGAVPNLSGGYRTVAPAADPSGGAVVCDAVTSKTRTYHVQHPRAFIRFLTAQDFAHHTMSFLFDIRSLDAFDDCVLHVPVQVQRTSGSTWVTIKTAITGHGPYGPHTGGDQIVNQPFRAGTYRAYAPTLTMKGGAHNGDVCKPVTSKTSTFP